MVLYLIIALHYYTCQVFVRMIKKSEFYTLCEKINNFNLNAIFLVIDKDNNGIYKTLHSNRERGNLKGYQPIFKILVFGAKHLKNSDLRT